MEPHTWLVYFIASVGLSLSPGPNGLLALTHGALHGRRMAAYTIAGGALGFAVVIALSIFGIGALLQQSVRWLLVLKVLGGAYLVWLGIQLWRAPPLQAIEAPRADVSGWKLFRQGLLSAVTNPKGVLFFAAFLPQFIDPHRGLWTQFAVMTATFVAVEILTESVLAATAHRIKHWLARSGRQFNRVCGSLFAFIGIVLAARQ